MISTEEVVFNGAVWLGTAEIFKNSLTVHPRLTGHREQQTDIRGTFLYILFSSGPLEFFYLVDLEPIYRH